MVLIALLRALPSAFHPAALRLLVKTLMLTLLAFAAIGGLLWLGLHALRLHYRLSGGGYLEAAVTTIGLALAGWLLFRTIAMAIMALFADDIIVAVERDSYPDAAVQARPVGLARSARIALRSVGRAIIWNLLALPLYLALLVTGVGTALLFLIVNATLLARDMADMVEPRHPDLPPIPRLGRWLAGLVSALLFLIPFANLLAPIVSAAMAVHMLHGRTRK
jgi:CysZ protein